MKIYGSEMFSPFNQVNKKTNTWIEKLFFKCTDLKEPEVAQASLRLIQQCLLDEDSKKTPLAQDSLDHLAANGVSHKSDKISMETMKLIPGIYVQNIEVSFWIKFIKTSNSLAIKNIYILLESTLLKYLESLC